MISDFIGYAQKYHPRREIVSRDEDGRTHRYSYGEAGPRARQLSDALLQAGVERGDRIATLAMNGYRHFELFYGVSCIGAILHTVNPRLFEEQLVYILDHAGSKILFVDPGFIPLARKLLARLPAMERVVVLADHGAEDWESYESFIQHGDALYRWPVFDERTASSLCYTSGTTGNPKGVLYSHRSTVLHALAAAQRSAMGLSADDVIIAAEGVTFTVAVARGCSSMVVQQPSRLNTRVRFPSPAPPYDFLRLPRFSAIARGTSQHGACITREFAS
jgi:3-(methylthio)propionyl---CoA ligase